MPPWMELADYLVAGGALLAGFYLGRATAPKVPEPLKPVCSCEHGYGTHAEGGLCKGAGREAIGWDIYGYATKWRTAPCVCQRYDGPDPAIFGLSS